MQLSACEPTDRRVYRSLQGLYRITVDRVWCPLTIFLLKETVPSQRRRRFQLTRRGESNKLMIKYQRKNAARPRSMQTDKSRSIEKRPGRRNKDGEEFKYRVRSSRVMEADHKGSFHSHLTDRSPGHWLEPRRLEKNGSQLGR